MPQIFPEHDAMGERFRRTMYYGKLPAGGDRPSLPFTQMAVEQFTGVGLDALGEKLGRLDMARAADISRQSCAGPNSLVLALLYLDRLRKRNPDYLNTVSSADLFLVSLLVASKFLHDDGEEDEVFNDEWATSGGVDTKELNKLELGFLSALDWRIYVGNDEFKMAVTKVETDIALREISRRGWATYSDLTVLGSSLGLGTLWSLLVQSTMQVTAVCVTAYAASFLTLLSTAAVLSRTPVGPAAVSDSVRTLASSLSSVSTSSDDSSSSVPDFISVEEELLLRTPEELLLRTSPAVSPADLLTASLLVATLTSGSVSSGSGGPGGSDNSTVRNRNVKDRKGSRATGETKTDGDGYEADPPLEGGVLNQTRAYWLAENSRLAVGSDWDLSTRTDDDWDLRSLPDRMWTRDRTREEGEERKGDDLRAWLRDRTQFIHHSTDHNDHSSGAPVLEDDMVADLLPDPWGHLVTPSPLLDYLGRCPVLRWGRHQANW